MSKPRIVIRKRKKADGTYPLVLYFRQDGHRFREPVGVDVQADAWDPDKGQIRGRSTLVKRNNLRLETSLGKANEIIAAYHLAGVQLTPERFKAEFQNHASRTDFLSFWHEEMDRQYNRRLFGDALYAAETRTLEKVKAWRKGEPLLFSEINRKTIEKFDAWHQADLQARGFDGGRERSKSLQQIRKYLKAAAREGKEFTDPFLNFRWPRWKKQITYLDESELRTLLQMWEDKEVLRDRMEQRALRQGMRPFDVRRYTADKSVDNIWKHLNAFLFQCFTGVRDSDLKQLTNEHIRGDMLIFTPVKTKDTSGKVVFFPLTPIVRRFITSTSGHLVQCASNQKYNKQLKVIADLAGIDKNITTHVGRHTFGSTMVANGVSLVSLMELMGVKALKTVMVYAHSGLEQQKKELFRAQAEFLQ